jgi:hypothetical protein
VGSPGAPGVLSRPGIAGAAVVAGLAAIAAWVLAQPAPLALGGDNETLHHPLFVDALRQLGDGRLPLWTTGRWGGSPLIGDPVLGATYPPNYLGYLVAPLARAVDVAACVHLAVFALGLAWCLGRLGVRPWVAVVAVALAVANPAFVYVARSWINWWGAISWWPWLLGAALDVARTGRRVELAAVALAAQVYAGYPQYALHSGLLGLAVVLCTSSRPWGRRIVDASLVVGGGIGLAAPQLLPGLAMAAESMRLGPGGAERLAALDAAALGPAAWLEAVRASPSLLSSPCKLAPVAVVLALVGAMERRPGARVLALTALAAGIAASGPPWLMRGLRQLPLFDFFAGPFKFFYLCAFATHVLAALGLERLAGAPSGGRRLGMAVLAAAAIPTVGWPAAGLLGAVALPPRVLSSAVPAAALLVAGVFLGRSAALTTPQPFGRDAFTPLLRASPVDATATPADRWVALDESGGAVRQVGMNFGALWGIESVSGVGPLPPWREFDVLGNAEAGSGAALVGQLGVSRVVVRAGTPLEASFVQAGLERVKAFDRLSVLRMPHPAPRTFLAGAVRLVDAGEGVAAARHGTALSPGPVLVEAAPVGRVEEGDPAGRLEIVARSSGEHALRVDVARPTWLVAREPYYRSWAATIDGRPAEVRPAGGFFLAIRVEGGRHDVTLRYREPGLVRGLGVAMVTPLMLLAMGGRRRRTAMAAGTTV